MGVRGRDSLAELRKNIRALSSAGFRVELAQDLAAAAEKLVADEFRNSHDPYGREWAPLKSRNGKPLLDTGRMRNSVFTERTANGFRIRVSARYSIFHQYGTHPHQRASRVARQNARGRFASRKAKTAYLLKIRAHENTGIPQRQMIPEGSTGGLGPIWIAAFNREARGLLRRRLQRAA